MLFPRLFHVMLTGTSLLRNLRGTTAAFSAQPSQNVQLVLLDRDGVINEDVGSPGVTCPSQLKLTPNAAHAIGRLKRSNYKVAILTNQSCVGKNIITEGQLHQIHYELQSMLQMQDNDATWDKIYVCMSTTGENDPRMKPSPGMILEACEDFDVPASACLFVGDTVGDLVAAQRGGVSYRVLVATGYGLSLMGGKIPEGNEILTLEPTMKIPECVLPFTYVENLDSAVRWLLGEG